MVVLIIVDVRRWDPSHGWASVDRPARTYPQELWADIGCSLEDLPEVMEDRDEWREKEREREKESERERERERESGKSVIALRHVSFHFFLSHETCPYLTIGEYVFIQWNLKKSDLLNTSSPEKWQPWNFELWVWLILFYYKLILNFCIRKSHTHIHTHTHTHTHTCIYIYIYICVCVCVCKINIIFTINQFQTMQSLHLWKKRFQKKNVPFLEKIPWFIEYLLPHISLVCLGCRIHRLTLCIRIRPPNECPGYDIKQSEGRDSSNAGALGKAKYPFIAIAP